MISFLVLLNATLTQDAIIKIRRNLFVSQVELYCELHGEACVVHAVSSQPNELHRRSSLLCCFPVGMFSHLLSCYLYSYS